MPAVQRAIDWLRPPRPFAARHERRPVRAAGRLALGLVGLVGLLPAGAQAYEFDIAAQTSGQGYQVRWLRPGAEDVLLNRRRFVQSLDLSIWDLLEPAVDPAEPERPRRAPFRLSLVTALRVENDYGTWLTGDVTYQDGPVRVRESALEAVPELGEQHIALDLPYAYLLGRGLFGRLDFQLGRQLVLDPLDWYAFDGLMLRVHLPGRFMIETHGGLLVRGGSAWASSRWDPDGTADDGCERVEVGGTSWIEADDCSQRQALMPGFGVAVATDGWSWLDARLAWRRAMSRTSDAFPTSADDWGVNQELLTATVRLTLLAGHVAPSAWLRDNLALGGIDDAGAELRLSWGAQALTPGVRTTRPSFDLDSIFNVFASEPSTDVYASYDVGRGRVRGHASLSLRRFDVTAGEGDTLAMGEALPGPTWARELSAGVQVDRVQLEVYGQNGEGGRRAGVDLSGRGRINRSWDAEGRATILSFDEPRLARVGTTLAMQGGARWTFTEGLSLHLLGEYNVNRFEADQLRVMAILDLAMVPEL
jgi:hypothetical protein